MWSSGIFPEVNYNKPNCIDGYKIGSYEGNREIKQQIVEVERIDVKGTHYLCKDKLGRWVVTYNGQFEESTEEEWLKQFPQTLFNIFN